VIVFHGRQGGTSTFREFSKRRNEDSALSL
jgi:hypothetical protein